MPVNKGIIVEAIAREMRSGVLVLNSSGRAVYANPYLVNSFAVSDGVEGKPVEEIIPNTTLLESIHGYLSGSAAAREDIEINEDGRFFKVHIVPLEDKVDLTLLVFLQDITEEKRVETIKKDFVANVSHELRTPLASIKGYSETLLDGGLEDAGTLKKFLRIIDRHATRMARLIEDLLILSRLESHQVTVVSDAVDLGELISAAATGFEKQARDKGIKLSCTLPANLSKVSGDRDRLEQVVVNLLDNAIKYTPSGGSVAISAAETGGAVRVEVKDTGIGIPAADIPRIFERFYRVDKARSRELGGTGLGLAIVKHIIQVHNGRLAVKSTPGEGSTFIFTIRVFE